MECVHLAGSNCTDEKGSIHVTLLLQAVHAIRHYLCMQTRLKASLLTLAVVLNEPISAFTVVLSRIVEMHYARASVLTWCSVADVWAIHSRPQAIHRVCSG